MDYFKDLLLNVRDTSKLQVMSIFTIRVNARTKYEDNNYKEK